MDLLRWRHFDTTSDLLFNGVLGSAQAISSFSGKHKSRKPYVTLKDHKDNFLNSLKCRLINPAKSEIGIISKYYVEKINDNIQRKGKLQQRRNTSSVPLDGTHLVAVRGLTHQEVPTRVRQRTDRQTNRQSRLTNRPSQPCQQFSQH